MKVIFILDISFKNYIYNKDWPFFSYWFAHFELLLGLERGYVYHDVRIGKEGIYNKQLE